MAISQPIIDYIVCAETKCEQLLRTELQKLSEIKYPRNPSPKSRKHWSKAYTRQISMAISQPFLDSLICAETKYEQLQQTNSTKLTEINPCIVLEPSPGRLLHMLLTRQFCDSLRPVPSDPKPYLGVLVQNYYVF